MLRTSNVVLVLAGILIAARPAAAELIEGNDPRAKPFKAALDALVQQIVAGDFDKAKTLYAGERGDLELLKAYVDAYRAAKNMRAVMQAKFGEKFKEKTPFERSVETTSVRDLNTVIFGTDPDLAESSANNPLGVGIEFKRVNGTWKVLSLVSAPDTLEQHLPRLKKYIAAINAIAEKVKSGECKSENDAIEAVGKAEVALKD